VQGRAFTEPPPGLDQLRVSPVELRLSLVHPHPRCCNPRPRGCNVPLGRSRACHSTEAYATTETLRPPVPSGAQGRGAVGSGRTNDLVSPFEWERAIASILRQHRGYLEQGVFTCGDYRADFVTHMRDRIPGLTCAR
jgi:hypothetical protein